MSAAGAEPGERRPAEDKPERGGGEARAGRPSVVVIGGGWAGCAAAVELAQRGYRVELHETAAVLGGRARRVDRDGLPLDNGEHLLLGAYADTLALAESIRDEGAESAWTVTNLAIRPLASAQRNALSLCVPRLPASLGLVAAMLRAGGLSWNERAATLAWFARQRIRGYACEAHATVAEVLAALPARARTNLFAPICVAALNTPPERASGRVFLEVLRETFGAGARSTAIVAPRHGLADAIPDQAGRWLAARGHAVRMSKRTRVSATGDDAVAIEPSDGVAKADAVIVAVGPHQLAATMSEELARSHPGVAAALDAVAAFEYEPIATVYLGYASAVSLPAGLVRLDDAPGQWLFDRSEMLRRAEPAATRPSIEALLSVVISAHGAHESLAHPALVAAIDAQLRRLVATLPPLVWSQVIEERRATYACVPALVRPDCGRLAPRIYLAGDYTWAALPATLEAAVRSGRAAARALARDHPQ